MTGYKRGDVVLVPFPFSSQTGIKKRPAVIVSSDSYNRFSSDVVIMAVTSKKEKTLKSGEYVLEDWKRAGLLKPSVIKLALATVERTLVLKKLGRLSESDLARAENALSELLDLKKK